MTDIRIVLNRRGVAELLKHPRVQQDLDRRAENIAARAGEGMEAVSTPAKRRAHSTVRTGTERPVLLRPET